MKHLSVKMMFTVAMLASSSVMFSCQSNNADINDNNSTLDSQAASMLPDTTIMTDQPAAAGGPAVPMNDATLNTNVKDAVKDFPGVTATVENGAVTLTGTISRDRLPQLLQNINNLNPQKVNNNLTIK